MGRGWQMTGRARVLVWAALEPAKVHPRDTGHLSEQQGSCCPDSWLLTYAVNLSILGQQVEVVA